MDTMTPPSATEVLWRESSARLKAWFERETGDACEAEDLVQETFVRVHERLDTLLDASSVRAWVGKIARHVLIDHQRRRGNRAAAVVDQDVSGASAEANDLDDNLDANLDPVVASWLEAYLSQMDPADAEALRLVDLEGKTQRELAELQDLSLSGAKSRVQRARARLRERLEACCALAFDARGGIVDYEPRRPDECQGSC